MSNLYLPPEILDCVVDLLHNELEPLRTCCLASKSWVPRTRKHLFAKVEFPSEEVLGSWKRAFPDPSNSPAYHTRTLYVGCPEAFAAEAEEGGWIQAFSRVASLNVDNVDLSASVSWLHKFSPTLKSLYVYPTLSLGSPFFGLIHSSPLLEDLTIVGYDPFGNDDGVLHGPRIVGPSTSPPLAGSLDLEISAGVGYAARRLLDLPTGLHFRNLTLTRFHTGDVRWIAELVERCSDTLEYLDITCRLPIESEPVPIDLSKATKLKGAVFRLDSEGIEWVTLALRTVTPEHRALRQISIYVPHWFPFLSLGVNIRPVLREENSKRWSDLDHLLFQFWESHSIRPRVGCKGLGEKGQNLVHFIGFLFPKTMQRGIIDLDY